MSAARAPGDALTERDPFDVRLARGASGLLARFNVAGVLTAADVRVAERLGALGGERDEPVLLAAALAVRAPRLGHVQADLARVRETAAVESDEPLELARLPWPEVADWTARVGGSPLVAVGEQADSAASEPRPLRLSGTRLYLDRYWAEECALAAALLARGGRADAPPEVDEAVLATGLRELFAGEEDDDSQRLAAATAVLRRLAVIAGGPGTGKTTTVARVLALLAGQAAARGQRFPLVALAAPTGKAAVRLEEAVHEQAQALPLDDATRARLLELEAVTLHRLLGRRPDTGSRFRHDGRRHLPHDVVVVDETSMVPLSLMVRLVEALRPQARLVLVGDPGQLASIEAGAVLGDIVGPAAERPVMSAAARERLATVTGVAVPAAPGADPAGDGQAGSGAIGDGIVVLERVHRFGGRLAELARAVRRGEAEQALDLLGNGGEDLLWLPVSPGAADGGAAATLEPVRTAATRAAVAVVRAARAADGVSALAELGRFRLLCAHRRGPFGVAAWSARVQAWLAAALPDFDPDERWYAGRPLLVTENDYELELFNGDSGVIVADGEGRRQAAFERRGALLRYSPARLSAVETLHAMTVHKSQGSQFEVAAVLLPEPDSRLLTRELLYTAITRAQRRLIVAGSEAAIRTAIERPIARASGLRERLWGG